MDTALPLTAVAAHPVQIRVPPDLEGRNRLTVFFRFFLALPHLILVGGPIAASLTWNWQGDSGDNLGWSTGGVLGIVAGVVAIIAWFAILFTGRYPDGLWKLAAYYLHWRLRAVAYFTLLSDRYPPFGEGEYPATLELNPPAGERNRLTVAFRLILALPHLIAIAVLGIAWFLTTLISWCWILLTVRFPATLFDFGTGVLRWTLRVEAYLLLLRDEYPPFALE